MTRSNIIQEILNVITCSNFKVSDYGEFGKEIKKTVTSWVTANNVTDVEIFVDNEGLSCTFGDDALADVTTLNINYIEDYITMQELADEKLGDDCDGPNWNGYTREDTRWNSEYLFTGSDGTFYTLIKKIA